MPVASERKSRSLTSVEDRSHFTPGFVGLLPNLVEGLRGELKKAHREIAYPRERLRLGRSAEEKEGVSRGKGALGFFPLAPQPRGVRNAEGYYPSAPGTDSRRDGMAHRRSEAIALKISKYVRGLIGTKFLAQ